MADALIPYVSADELDIEDICNSVSNGETLLQYCKVRNLAYGDVHQWITKHAVRNRQYSEALATRKDLQAENLGSLIYKIVSFDPKDIHHIDGTYKNIHEWPAEARAALESLKVDPMTGAILEAKFASRIKAVESVGKMLGLYREKKEKVSDETFAEIVIRSMKNDR